MQQAPMHPTERWQAWRTCSKCVVVGRALDIPADVEVAESTAEQLLFTYAIPTPFLQTDEKCICGCRSSTVVEVWVGRGSKFMIQLQSGARLLQTCVCRRALQVRESLHANAVEKEKRQLRAVEAQLAGKAHDNATLALHLTGERLGWR